MKVTANLKKVDKGLAKLRQTLATVSRENPHVKVGLLGDVKAARPGEAMTNAQLGIIHEFGTSDGLIPARPFIFPTFEKNKAQYKAALAKLIAPVFEGGKATDLETALKIIGQKASADMKTYVTQGAPIQPDNAESTKERKEAKRRKGSKGVVRTLVDTGRMVGAITYQIVRGKP